MPHMTIIATSAAGVLFTQPPLVVGRSAPLCPLNPTRLSPRSPNRSPLAAMGGEGRANPRGPVQVRSLDRFDE